MHHGVLGGQAGPEGDHPVVGHAGLQQRPGRHQGPAAPGGDLPIRDKALAEAVVAGVGRRQAVEPCLELILAHRAGEVRGRIVGCGPQPPVVEERGVGQTAYVHRLGVTQYRGGELGLAGLARPGVRRAQQALGPGRRRELSWLETMGVGEVEGLLQELDLVRAELDLGRGGREILGLTRLRRGRLAKRVGAAHGERQGGDHRRAHAADIGQTRPQSDTPAASAGPTRFVTHSGPSLAAIGASHIVGGQEHTPAART